jgi:hypothetical protein
MKKHLRPWTKPKYTLQCTAYADFQLPAQAEDDVTQAADFGNGRAFRSEHYDVHDVFRNWLQPEAPSYTGKEVAGY